MENNSPKIILVLIGIATFSNNALATDNVSSPYIEQGKLSLQYRSGYDFDNAPSKDRKQAYKLVANYGTTDRLRPEIKAVLSDNPNESTKVTGFEAGLRWQFLKPEEAWLTAALDGNYKTSIQSGKPDKFELKLILGKKFGQFFNVANLSVEEEIGENSRDGASLKAAWKTGYKINSYFAPGFEFYANTGNLRDDLDYNDQSYRIGPTAYGNITENVTYNIGYLFGISEAATDGRVKMILSYVKRL